MWLLVLLIGIPMTRLVHSLNCAVPDPSSALKISVDPLTSYDVDTESVQPGAKVTFECYSGFTFSGTAEVTCLVDGNFDGEPPLCTANDDHCKLPENMNGMIVDSATLWSKQDRSILAPASVNFACEFGYTLGGPSYKQCTSEGTWNEAAIPTCIAAYCELPPTDELVIDISEAYTYNDKRVLMPAVIHFSCHSKHTLVGPTQATCNNLKWDYDTPPYCEVTSCDLPDGENLVIETAFEEDIHDDHVASGVEVTYSCQEGWVLVGPSKQTCHEDGFHPPGPSACYKTCLLNAMKHTMEHIIITAQPVSSYVQGDRKVLAPADVSFSCKGDHSLIGADKVSCGEDGQWQDDLPACHASGERCDLPKTEGLLVEIYQGHEYDYITIESPAKVRFSCEFGYELAGEAFGICMASGMWELPLPSCKDNGLRSDVPNDSEELAAMAWGFLVLLSIVSIQISA